MGKLLKYFTKSHKSKRGEKGGETNRNKCFFIINILNVVHLVLSLGLCTIACINYIFIVLKKHTFAVVCTAIKIIFLKRVEKTFPLHIKENQYS